MKNEFVPYEQALFANGERVYLKEDNNVSQVVDDNTKDWSLWERLPKQETNLKKHLDSCEEYQGPRRSAIVDKQETLEEAAERKFQNIGDRLIFEDGAKWQKERSYSESDILKIINLSRKLCSIDGNIDLDDDNLQGNLEGFILKYTVEQLVKQFKQ